MYRKFILSFTLLNSLISGSEASSNKRKAVKAKKSPKSLKISSENVVDSSRPVLNLNFPKRPSPSGISARLSSESFSSFSATTGQTGQSYTTGIETEEGAYELFNFDIDINDNIPEVDTSTTASGVISARSGTIPSSLDVSDPFELIEDMNMFNGEVPDESSAWNYDEEASWGVPDRHYFQYFASIANDTLSIIFASGHPADFFEGKYDFDQDWSGVSNSVDELASKYQALALKNIVKPAHANSLRKLISGGLIDLSKPILNKETGVYHSFLTITFVENNIEPEKFDIILRYCPKELVNKPSSNGIVPLLYAVRQERFDLVQKLVFFGADINFTNGILLTPFMEALKLKQNLTIDYFLTLNAHNPNILVQEDVTALALAGLNLPSQKFNQICDKLTFDCPIPISNSTYLAALKQLYLKNDTANDAAFDHLVEKALNFQSAQMLDAVMHLANYAVISNNVQLVHHLDLLKVPLNTAHGQYYLIHIAAEMGSIDVVQYFIASKIFPVDSMSAEGLTPIQYANANGHKQTVIELIKLEALVGLARILQDAIEANDIEIIQTLVNYRTGLSLFDLPNGYNLVTWAVTKDKPQILRLLLMGKGIKLTQNDALGNNYYTVQVPKDASKELLKILSTNRQLE